MTSRRRGAALALALLVFCATPGAGWAANNCAAGGKPRPDEGGIGGTGARPIAPDQDDSGIGGTGISRGDTGIIGTITGFASICVGGVEIHYDVQSTVQMDGQPAAVDQLAVGQVVEVVAAGTGSEVRAQQIAVHHVVVGPVTRLDVEHGEIDVIGQTVQLPSPDAGAPADYALGAFVQVSGLRRGDGIIVASRVARAEVGLSHVAGPVTEVGPQGLVLGRTPVRVEGTVPVSVGDEIRVAGYWDGEALQGTAIESMPRVPFDGRVTRLDIEGYARREPAGQLRVGAFVLETPHSAPTDALPEVARDARVRVQAVVENGRLVVERIGVLAERPSPPQPREGDFRSGQHGAAGRDPRNQIPGERPNPAGMPARPPDGRGVDAPARPDRPDRPAAVDLPERPPRIERPNLPDRPVIPDRPPRPERPGRP